MHCSQFLTRAAQKYLPLCLIDIYKKDIDQSLLPTAHREPMLKNTGIYKIILLQKPMLWVFFFHNYLNLQYQKTHPVKFSRRFQSKYRKCVLSIRVNSGMSKTDLYLPERGLIALATVSNCAPLFLILQFLKVLRVIQILGKFSFLFKRDSILQLQWRRADILSVAVK